VALAFVCAAVVVAQPHHNPIFAAGAISVTIPLDIDNNIIRMKVRINGSRPLMMIFDTGATMSIVDEGLVKELGLKPTSDKLNGHGTGGDFTGSYIKSTTISVGEVEIAGQPFAAIKLNKPPDFDFDGIIGYDFIAPFVVEIDYDAKTLRLTDQRGYVYHGKGATIPLDLKGRKTPLISATFRIPHHALIVAKLEVDSGFDGAFQLNSPVVRRQRLSTLFKNGRNDVSHGAGGDEQDMTVWVSAVTFGGINIERPPVALSLATKGAGAATDTDGLIGGEVLRRFRVILDYSRRRMILEKNKAFDDPYQDNRD
jgi:hypothetical protein